MRDNAIDISTTIVEVCDAATTMYRLRLQGVGVKELARQFKIPEKRVRETVVQMCEPVDAMTRGRMLQIELERLEELQRAHHEAATHGDTTATVVLLKIMEHRAALSGLFASAAVRADPVELVEAGHAKVTTTDKIQLVLDEIAAGKPRLIAADGALVETESKQAMAEGQ